MASPNDYPWQGSTNPTSRGAFIVIEGLDRSGKTTQVKKLCDRLYSEGNNVKTLRFPDRTSPIGQMIDSYLQSKTEMDDHAIHLLFSANRWEKAKWIKEQIAHGYTIICDRYVYSGMIYSAAKKNPGLNIAWARQCDEGLPRPDLVVFLDLGTGEQERRGGYGDEKYEKREMQEKVRELFKALYKIDGDEKMDMVTVDAGPGVEEVAQKVASFVSPVLNNLEAGAMGELRTVRPWEQGVVDKIPEFRP